MAELPVALVCLALLIGLAVLAGRQRRRRRALARMLTGETPDAVGPEVAPSVLRRHRLVPVVAGLAMALLLIVFAHVRVVTAISLGVVEAVVGSMIESAIASRRELKVQAQLADAIDIMVGALSAGAAVNAALAAGASESSAPLRGPLEDLVGQLRLGVAPQAALAELAERIPLESFRLFTVALAVHWETGGSLTPALAVVGRTIRDRIELSRRVRAQTTEARASAVGVLAIIYVIALFMWKVHPEAMESLLSTRIGSTIWAVAVMLQAAGLLWMVKISEIEM